MTGIYRAISDKCKAIWTDGWTHADVPAFWRSNDAEPNVDPIAKPYYFRNEISLGAEELAGFGGGRGANLKAQYGSVVLNLYASRMILEEDDALDLLGDAVALYRSYRGTDTIGNDLSFIGPGSGFDGGPTESGNWFSRGNIIVFSYRFVG